MDYGQAAADAACCSGKNKARAEPVMSAGCCKHFTRPARYFRFPAVMPPPLTSITKIFPQPHHQRPDVFVRRACLQHGNVPSNTLLFLLRSPASPDARGAAAFFTAHPSAQSAQAMTIHKHFGSSWQFPAIPVSRDPTPRTHTFFVGLGGSLLSSFEALPRFGHSRRGFRNVRLPWCQLGLEVRRAFNWRHQSWFGCWAASGRNQTAQ